MEHHDTRLEGGAIHKATAALFLSHADGTVVDMTTSILSQQGSRLGWYQVCLGVHTDALT